MLREWYVYAMHRYERLGDHRRAGIIRKRLIDMPFDKPDPSRAPYGPGHIDEVCVSLEKNDPELRG